jgi:FtsH-binding integral membrane protein
VKIQWGRAFGGALIAEIALIAAAFGWVAVYSYVINPGQPFATYQAHAQASGTWVSIFAGAPIFYAASRWIARSQPTALALFAIFAVVDGALLVGMTESWTGFPFVLVGLSYVTKLPACALGGRHG